MGRGRIGEAKTVWSGQTWEVCLPLGVMVKSRSGWQPRAMSGSVALLQPGTLLKTEVPFTIKVHTDVWGLGLCYCLMDTCQWGHVDLNGLHCHLARWWHPELVESKSMSCSIFLPQMGSVLKSKALVVTRGHMEGRGEGHNLWPHWCPRLYPCTRQNHNDLNVCASPQNQDVIQAWNAAKGHV